MSRVLILEEEPAVAQAVSEICVRMGLEPLVYRGAEEVVGALASLAPDLVLTDSPGFVCGGVGFLAVCQRELPGVPVIVITAERQIQCAVEAMKNGAQDYISKPIREEVLRGAIQGVLSVTAKVLEHEPACSGMSRRTRWDNIIGGSARMQAVFRVMAKIADSESTVLVLGESGTGKELVAKALHYQSTRRGGPFVAVNCSALPANLLESELFGHKKGAFTGALQDKLGLFEEAEGGTIFLDEVSAMELSLQAKLLRVLQERVVRRVGENRSIPIKVRVVASSNEPLLQKIKSGGFREDLYYRLAVIPIEMPPLRERAEDIPLLIRYFLERNAAGLGRGAKYEIDEEVLRAMCQYRWPGNVRELENAVERACALCEGRRLTMEDLPPQVRPEKESPSVKNFALPVGYKLADFTALQEKLYIQETIRFTGGTRELAARMLGISPATLYRKLDAKLSTGVAREVVKIGVKKRGNISHSAGAADGSGTLA